MSIPQHSCCVVLGDSLATEWLSAQTRTWGHWASGGSSPEGPHCCSLGRVARPWSGWSATWTWSWRAWQPLPAAGREVPPAPGLALPCAQDTRHRLGSKSAAGAWCACSARVSEGTFVLTACVSRDFEERDSGKGPNLLHLGQLVTFSFFFFFLVERFFCLRS